MLDHDKRRYVGMTSEQAEVIEMQNKARQNMKELSETNWNDIEPLKAQMIIDILNDEYECQSCENKDEHIQSLTENFRDYNSDVEHDVILMVKHHADEGMENEKEEMEYHLSCIREIVKNDYEKLIKKYRNYLPER